MDDTQLHEQRKQKVYQLICEKQYVPMKIKEIAIFMQVAKEDRPELEKILEELIRDGKIMLTKRGKYKIAEETYLTGTFHSTSRGFGFVELEEEKEDREEVFISEDSVNGALHGDTVQIKLLPGQTGRRREGVIVKILAHAVTELVGTYEKCSHYGFVVPDDLKFSKDVFVAEEHSMGAMDGHKVLVEITDYGDGRKNPEGTVIKIIGHKNDPGTDILSFVYDKQIPVEFPEKVVNQAQRQGQEVSEADRAGRLDLRGMQMVTIDGEDAKDLDDAVSLSYDEANKCWKLGVHIADVTNYVQEHSALDVEAFNRGTSVYLADRVIPMLPHALSNGICSLNEGQDRLALSCLMEVDEKGNIIGHQIAESVICVDRRMSYTSVKKILADQDQEEIKKYEPLVPMFREMERLSSILRERRRKRGAIDFDFPESKIRLNDEGQAVEIVPYERNVATKLIEDFMLAANETVAEDFYWQGIPFLYRSHENPDPEKIKELSVFISNFGLGIKNGREELHPKELQKLLTRIEDTPQEALISRLVLRSMKRAKYTVECSGHFGLASKYYCHFTSPIRRYPDLQIHRIIKETLRGKMTEERLQHYESILPEAAVQCSMTERRADEAERETDKMKKAEYMLNHLGEVYDGVICGMTEYGFYVELPNTVEGLVHVSSLIDDRYYFDNRTYEMTGNITGRKFRLGDTVTVCVTNADKELRTVDFRIVNKEE